MDGNRPLLNRRQIVEFIAEDKVSIKAETQRMAALKRGLATSDEVFNE